MPTHQRLDAISNAAAGKEFEVAASLYFEETGIKLASNFKVAIGYVQKKYMLLIWAVLNRKFLSSVSPIGGQKVLEYRVQK